MTSDVAILSPDPALVERATFQLGARQGLEVNGVLEIGQPCIRSHSTVWPLAFSQGSEAKSNVAYYKQVRLDWMSSSLKEGLARSEALTPRLAEALGPKGIVPAAVLAIDADRGAIVTEALHGTTMNKWGTHKFRNARAATTLQQLRMLGLVARHIEEIECPRQSAADRACETRHFGNDLKRADELGAELPLLLTELFADASAQVSYVHGDLSNTNVLALKTGLGIIDIGWNVRFKGFDVACLTHRLEFGTRAPARWRRRAIAAVLDGYGELGSAEAGFRFYRMQRLLRVAARGRPYAARRARRRLFEAMREEPRQAATRESGS